MMNVRGITQLLILFSFFMLSSSSVDTRSICFVGSSLYQEKPTNCASKNTSYTGTWYCVTATVCEAGITQRRCIKTKGCATELQCTSPNANSIYSKSILTVGQNATLPGGMTVTTTCCPAVQTPDDDLVSTPYNTICNSASSNRAMSAQMLMTTTLISVASVLSIAYVSFF